MNKKLLIPGLVLAGQLAASVPFLSALGYADENPRELSDAPRYTLGDDLRAPWTHARTELLTGSAVTLLLVILEDPVVDSVQYETVEDRPLGKYSSIARLQGLMVPNGLYALGFGLHAWFNKDSRSAEKSLTMIKSSLYAAAVSTALKYSIREPRPDGSGRDSFPSGHSTAIGAFAGTILAQEPLGFGIASAGLAALVAYSRMNDNRHFVHDVTAGLTLGIATGLGLGRLHSEDQEEPRISIVPKWSIDRSTSLQFCLRLD